MKSYSHPQEILKRIAAFCGDIALCVVTDISGGTLRAKGALMGVTQDEVFGYISAGCVDGDIIFQARQVLRGGKTKDLIYGEGSLFKDINLPCGGAISVKIISNPDKAEIQRVSQCLEARKSAILNLAGLSQNYHPALKLRIAGRGEPFGALAKLALTSGLRVIGQSPEKELASDNFERFDHLTDPTSEIKIIDDKWTAVVFLFHDHEWEPKLLEQALSGDAFYIGAMGSGRTHALRLETLKAMDSENTDRIKGPIGLIPAMRDAQLLAVSILADIINEARKKNLI